MYVSQNMNINLVLFEKGSCPRKLVFCFFCGFFFFAPGQEGPSGKDLQGIGPEVSS